MESAPQICTKERISKYTTKKLNPLLIFEITVVVVIAAWVISQIENTEFDPLFGWIQLLFGSIWVVIYIASAIIIAIIVYFVVRVLMKNHYQKDCEKNPVKYNDENISKKSWGYDIFNHRIVYR